MQGEALEAFHTNQTMILELDKLEHTFGPIDVGGATSVSIQASLIEGAWGSAVLTVKRSNDGEVYGNLATGATTISSNGITTITPDTKFLQVYVSTAGSAGDKVRVTVYSKLS